MEQVFRPLFRTLEVFEARRNRIEQRLEENLTAARVLMETAMQEPVVRGSTGQMRAHPLFAAAAACDATALAIWKALAESEREATEAVYGLIHAAGRGEQFPTLSAEDEARLLAG